MGTAQQTFELKWQNHETNLKCAFDQLLQAQAFVDATLVCEDVSLKVHQVVLSAASPYLRRIFLDHPSGHPVIILQDLDEVGMRCLVNFIYSGEVQVTLERLHALLKCAQLLQIHGFIDACRRSDDYEVELGSIVQPTTSTESSNPLEVDHERPQTILSDSDQHFTGLVPDSNGNVDPELDDHIDSMSAGDSRSCEPDGATLFSGAPSKLARRRARRRSRRQSVESASFSECRVSTDNGFVTLIKTEVMSPPPLNGVAEQQDEMTESLQVGLWAGSELSVSEVMSDGGHVYSSAADHDLTDEMDHNEGSTCSLPRRHLLPDAVGRPTTICITQTADELPSGSSSTPPDLTFRSASDNSSSRRLYHPVVPVGNTMSIGSRNQYRCNICPKTCNRKFNMVQHMKTHNPYRETHACLLCERVYQRKGELVRHHKKMHDGADGS